MQNRQTIITTLLLSWYCLTGSYAGWYNGWLLAINMIVLAALLLIARPRAGSVTYGIMAMMLAILVSTAVNGQWRAGLTQLAVWAGYLAISNVTTLDCHICAAARLVIIPYTIIALIAGFHVNVIAFNVVGLALVAGWPWLALIVNGWLMSLGAILAVVGQWFVLSANRYRWLVFGLAPILVIDYHMGNSWSIHWGLLADSLRDFWAAPLYGLGPGSYRYMDYWHSHNFITTTAAELGLIGLAALSVLVWSVYRRWVTLPRWSKSLILAMAIWSLVDEPLRFWSVGFMVAVALGAGND